MCVVISRQMECKLRVFRILFIVVCCLNTYIANKTGMRKMTTLCVQQILDHFSYYVFKVRWYFTLVNLRVNEPSSKG